ncbi:unnamed protein product [Linum trigynum]|uniref:DUF674 domain-containing protein n=1 Tax=Linum trigynum TaxID=586398 RepID=A0AAV2G870_9ROSI
MAAASKVTLKLLVDKKSHKVLFGEAGKEFVDFLFTILSLPLGTVTRLLSKKYMVGCLGNLYQSIGDLNDTFIQPTLNKHTILNPETPTTGSTLLLVKNQTSRSQKALIPCQEPVDPNNSSCWERFNRGSYTTTLTLLSDDGSTPTRNFYTCQYSHRVVTFDPLAMCPKCSSTSRMQYAVELVASPAKNNEAGWSGEEGGGFVKGVMTYMVMDDLEVKPMSTICSITLLNKFNIQEVGALEEMFIEIGMDEVTDPFRYD